MVNTKTCIENGSHELELAAFELKSAINSMDTFLGKITSQDVLEVVFSNFCVGK
jgi:tRNA U34 5-carboxymethylaminomethyl modifying GTPase MnmE/TrmE